MSPAALRRVVVADDEENIRLVLETLLKKSGYDVRVAASGSDALEIVKEFAPDFVLADVRMPGLSGIELCARLKQQGLESTVIVMSAFGSIELALEAMAVGAYDYISKPFKQDEVLLALRKAEERESLRRENKALKAAIRREAELGDMLGRSPPMQALFRTLQKVAAHTTTVLIQGESGTGKELVARNVHRLSQRSGKAFVAVNCGAIPENLLESELFGHKRGSFTGAHQDKRGLFEAAHQGTLFLDEIGELPLQLQVKLLRVLQEGTIRPLGETQDRQVDVRVVAATIRDLEHEVAEGRFREDLFYRLNVVQLVVPPLRARAEDIPLLIEHFLERNNARMGTAVHTIEPRARKCLLDYPWPGNVRELQNVIERAVVLADSDHVTRDDLPERLREPNSPVKMVLANEDLSIKRTTRYIEEALIRRALEQTRGNRTAASRLLEISHRALLYKIKDYGIR